MYGCQVSRCVSKRGGRGRGPCIGAEGGVCVGGLCGGAEAERRRVECMCVGEGAEAEGWRAVCVCGGGGRGRGAECRMCVGGGSRGREQAKVTQRWTAWQHTVFIQVTQRCTAWQHTVFIQGHVASSRPVE